MLTLLRVLAFDYGAAAAFPSTFDGSMISAEGEAAVMRLLAASAQQYLDGCGSELQEDEELLRGAGLLIYESFVLEAVAGEKRAATRVKNFAKRTLAALGG